MNDSKALKKAIINALLSTAIFLLVGIIFSLFYKDLARLFGATIFYFFGMLIFNLIKKER